jgi:Cys-rich protein (TIGR01571 family)
MSDAAAAQAITPAPEQVAAAPAPAPEPVAQPAAAPAGGAAGGPVDDQDIAHWKQRISGVLAKPSEHLNAKAPESAAPWHASFLECFNPIDLCLITYCVPCVTFGKTHHRLHKAGNLEGYEPINTNCLLLCAAGCVGFFWVPIAIQRADVRAKYNLQGDAITDIAAACCCHLCTLVQNNKEATFHEEQALLVQPAGDKTGHQPDSGMAYPAATQ